MVTSNHEPRGTATKYLPLIEYLSAQQGSDIRCTFAQIEAIIGFPLPRTARTVTGFWTDRLRPHVRAWQQTGWQAHMDFPNRCVTFHRDSAASQADV
ncbi:MAG: hypothetical protein LC748_13125 [Thermomicrobia bacterium]|nr:hypothetical protein [Thermomicrobia bacterium]